MAYSCPIPLSPSKSLLLLNCFIACHHCQVIQLSSCDCAHNIPWQVGLFITVGNEPESTLKGTKKIGCLVEMYYYYHSKLEEKYKKQ